MSLQLIGLLMVISLPLLAERVVPSPDEVLQQQRPSSWPEGIDVGMDESILVDESLRKKFTESLSLVPSLLLEMTDENLVGKEGLYFKEVNPEKGGSEVPVKATYWHPKKKGFTINCGIRLHGNEKLLLSPKRNFRLSFAGSYGRGLLEYPLFSGETEVFENLLLSSPTRDSWAAKLETWRTNPRYVNDRWATETARTLGHLAPRQEWIHVYLNQIYWGVYALSERPDENFAARHRGGAAKNYDVFEAEKLTAGGDDLRRKAARFLVEDFQNTPENFKQLDDFLDLPAFMDHLICQIYQGKLHWPDMNYFLVGHRGSVPRFAFGAWESQVGFYEEYKRGELSTKNALYFSPLSSTRFLNDQSGPGFWYRHLAKSAEFRLMLADRLHLLIGEKGVLSPSKAAERYRLLLDEVSPFLLAESLRWGGSQRQKPYTPYGEEWEELTGEKSWLFTRFFPLRGIAVKKHFRDEKVWPKLEPPTHFTRLDRKGETRFYLKNVNPRGIIVFTTDGSDPREKWTGKPKGKAFREHLVLDPGTRVEARILEHKTWSALMTYESP